MSYDVDNLIRKVLINKLTCRDKQANQKRKRQA